MAYRMLRPGMDILEFHRSWNSAKGLVCVAWNLLNRGDLIGNFSELTLKSAGVRFEMLGSDRGHLKKR
ncbi:hypothetical protein NL676_038939 [Syzygium grande]|nr:hypothetical protein NL676_038939 [Syzygium grande]